MADKKKKADKKRRREAEERKVRADFIRLNKGEMSKLARDKVRQTEEFVGFKEKDPAKLAEKFLDRRDIESLNHLFFEPKIKQPALEHEPAPKGRPKRRRSRKDIHKFNEVRRDTLREMEARKKKAE